MKSASRTIRVVGGGTLGFLTAGPLGALVAEFFKG